MVTGGLLADEMGLGKTITTLALIAEDLQRTPLPRDPTELKGGSLV